MTKKDYVLIARALYEARFELRDANPCQTVIINDLASALERDNPRFDRQRFIDAASYGKGL
jgi:hypothetical protein